MTSPYASPDFSTERSIAHDFSTRHTTASTFTPARELAYTDLHTERPRPWSVPVHQGEHGPMGHPMGAIHDALKETAGKSMEEAEERHRKNEERAEAYKSEQPMQREYGASYGGHDFDQAKTEPVADDHMGEETPEKRFGSREGDWGGGYGLGSRWND
jgi:hypothetical protein